MSITFPLGPLTEADADALKAYYDGQSLTGINTIKYQWPAFVAFYIPSTLQADWDAADDAKRQDMVEIFQFARANQNESNDFVTVYNEQYTKKYG